MKRRAWMAVFVAVLTIGATGCRIAVPDGTIPGETGCEIWWLEPGPPGGLANPLSWFLFGSLAPLPVCDGMFPSG